MAKESSPAKDWMLDETEFFHGLLKNLRIPPGRPSTRGLIPTLGTAWYDAVVVALDWRGGPSGAGSSR